MNAKNQLSNRNNLYTLMPKCATSRAHTYVRITLHTRQQKGINLLPYFFPLKEKAFRYVNILYH